MAKRGSEDMNSSEQSGSPSKHNKLDFLAFIAEMSEKQDQGAAAATSGPAPAAQEAPALTKEPSAETLHQGAGSKPSTKPDQTSIPLKKRMMGLKNNDAPKSSFAAWKERNMGKKTPKASPGRKQISVVAGSPPVRKELSLGGTKKTSSSKKTSASASGKDDLVTPKKALGGPLPPKKAAMAKAAAGASANKKVIPKKAGNSVKKEGSSTKKKSAAAAGTTTTIGKPSASTKSKPSKKGSGHAGGKSSTFPEKIMELLQSGLATNAIYWLPEGEAIAVDPDNFKDSNIINKQFRGNKLSSFVRSLNRWGFRRIFYHSLPDKTLAFYHRLFQKQTPELVKEMKMDGGEKEQDLPPGVVPAPMPNLGDSTPGSAGLAIGSKPPVEAVKKQPMSPASSQPSMPSLPARAESAPGPAPSASQLVAAAAAARSPYSTSSAPASNPAVAASLERNNIDLSDGRQALQQAMFAEQERSDYMQQLQAQQYLLQSLSEQQNSSQAEELLMQSYLAEQQRSGYAQQQQRQAEHALLQQMLAEEQTAALAAALQGAGGGGFGLSEAALRDRLLAQQFGGSGGNGGGGNDILALLQQQLQGQQQQQQQSTSRELSYMEQLLLLEQQQQQQQQRQQEAALLAARGYRFN